MNQILHHVKLHVSGFEIIRVKVVKYLGLMVDDCLTWEQHVQYITKKINRDIGILKRVRHFLRRESLIILYETLIEPYYIDIVVLFGVSVVKHCKINYGFYKTEL